MKYCKQAKLPDNQNCVKYVNCFYISGRVTEAKNAVQNLQKKFE